MFVRSFRIISVALVFAGGVLSAPGSARADPPYVADPKTSAVVSLLSLTRSSGVLVVKVQFVGDDPISAIDAGVAAFGGRWAVSAAVDFAAQGVRCAGRTSAAGSFRYICRPVNRSSFPVGIYSFALPVRRLSGKRDGMTGTVYVSRAEIDYNGEPVTFRNWSDTFPVIDSAVHAGSSAEIRSIDLRDINEQDSVWQATAYLALNVSAGDRIEAVTFTLPAGPGSTWTVWSGYTADDVVWCAPTTAPATGADVVVECRIQDIDYFPAGTYQLEIPLQVSGNGAGIGTVFLHRAGAQVATIDTYEIRNDYFYYGAG